MNKLKKYKREVKRMFYMSVDKDIDNWKGGTSPFDDYESPKYNDYYFEVKREGFPDTNTIF